MSDAYSESSATDFETFSNEKSSVPQFTFWLTTLELELLLLTFVRSLREGNFHLYIEALHKMAPCFFFSLDRVNYSRWLPVHIREMQALSRTHPDILRNFVEGKFVIRNSEKNFSCISIDQAHEQNNKHVKGQGGIIGLTANESALNRWIVSGPEIVEMIQHFKESSKPTSEDGVNEIEHYEECEAFQEQFKLDVERLLVTMKEYGNPFSEDSTNTLVVLHNGNLKTGKSVENLCKIEEVGEKAYEAFVKERFVERTVSISKTNNLFIFNTETNHGKKQQQVTCLKNVSLFSRFFIACQNRDGNLDNFFQYENEDYPPSISIFNELRSGNKADLLKHLEEKADSPTLSEAPQSDMVIIYGAAIVNALKPDAGMTFKDYAANKVIPRISRLLSNVKRIDVVFYAYLEDSLKSTARLHRGQGSRKRVRNNYKVPSN